MLGGSLMEDLRTQTQDERISVNRKRKLIRYRTLRVFGHDPLCVGPTLYVSMTVAFGSSCTMGACLSRVGQSNCCVKKLQQQAKRQRQIAVIASGGGANIKLSNLSSGSQLVGRFRWCLLALAAPLQLNWGANTKRAVI